MEGATSAAFGMALVSLIGTVAAAVNARKLARDKMEFERAAARDKMEFDAKSVELSHRLNLVNRDLEFCREQHKSSESDRMTLRSEIAELRTLVKALESRGRTDPPTPRPPADPE